MKKQYETPDVEVVKFQYSDQVVAASTCVIKWINFEVNGKCTDPVQHQFYD